jgi:hypothetical protein
MKKSKIFSIIAAVMILVSVIVMGVQPRAVASLLFAGIGVFFTLLALIEFEKTKVTPNRFIDNR